jgi:hypothetical protein
MLPSAQLLLSCSYGGPPSTLDTTISLFRGVLITGGPLLLSSSANLSPDYICFLLLHKFYTLLSKHGHNSALSHKLQG